MRTKNWYPGNTWRPRFRVLDPVTRDPLALPSPPKCKVMYPGGETEEVAATVDEHDSDFWRHRHEIDASMIGENVLVVTTPDPYAQLDPDESILVSPLPKP